MNVLTTLMLTLMWKCIIKCFPPQPLLMKAGSPFIFLPHTTLDIVLPKVPFLLTLPNTLSGTVYTNYCSFRDGHNISFRTDNILVSDWSSMCGPLCLVPTRGALALHLVIACLPLAWYPVPSGLSVWGVPMPTYTSLMSLLTTLA